MAEVALTVQTAQPKLGGRSLTMNSLDFSTNTYKFLNHKGMVRLIFQGATSATGTVTITAQTPCSAGIDHDDTTEANALDASTKFVEMGPFDPNIFEDGNLYAWITGTGTTTGIKVALVKG